MGVARGATILQYGTGRYGTLQYERILECSRTVGVPPLYDGRSTVTDIRIVHVFVLSYTPYFHIVQ